MSNDYTGNAARLLSLGEIGTFGEWRDYLKMGLTTDDVPELLRMIDDESLYDLDLFGAEGWAPIHAWRALGQLRAAEAAEPLTRLFNRIETDDDDYAIEDIPTALAMIGAPAIAPLMTVIGDRDTPESVRTSAISALAGVAQTDGEHRADVVHFLAEVLDRHEPERAVNAYLVDALVDLRAVEAASSMEAAFDANVVALDLLGDWETVQVSLGLLDKRVTPKPGSWLQAEVIASGQLASDDELAWPDVADDQEDAAKIAAEKERRRKARKVEKAARKQQRVKKKKKRK